MKTALMILTCVLGLSLDLSLAEANDAAFPKIRVKGISPGPFTKGGTVTVYGGNADDFFKMLPALAIAGTERQQAEHAAKYRTLSLVSGVHSLNINCSKVHYDEKTSSEVPNVRGTECTISIVKPDNEGDSFDYKPNTCSK